MSDFFSAEGWLNTHLTSLNDVIWTYVLIGVLVFCALWFTFKLRFVQFRMLGEMVRLLKESPSKKKGEKHISSFQAFMVSIASRIGTGNLAGVATAIAVGGPGSVFWMWIMALLGSATAFAESTLAQLFKRRSKDSFIGGPAYYIKKGLHSDLLAKVFAVILVISFPCIQTATQSNTISGAMEGAFGISPMVMGIFMALVSLFIVFGGVHRVANFSSVVVPVMAIGYLLLALFIICRHFTMIPTVLGIIVEDAFGIRQIAGGGLGAAIVMGVKRGLFSNEAGEGSTPNVAATATTSHPVKQGLIQALGVFTDTIIVCSCTAFIILFSGAYTNSDLNGINLTQAALETEIGHAGSVFIAIAIFLFAFSSIIGNYIYGENNVRFLSDKKWVMTVFRIISGGVFVFLGAVASFDLAWSLVDFSMALITIVNIYAILRLSKWVIVLLKDYMDQKKEGNNSPMFHRSKTPELDLEAWDE
ncbi:MAG: alanine:cation symporter family protein [Bacteroidales bacterium]|nr:alanine:cation symporter family protein [Bacteroidales bacterium]